MKVGDLVVYEDKKWEINTIDADGFAWLTYLEDPYYNTGVLVSELRHLKEGESFLELVRDTKTNPSEV